MPATIFYLATCSTCKALLKTLAPPANTQLREIKSQPITASELDYLRSLAGSYEALFSRKAVNYRLRNLKSQTLTEGDYRRLILEDHTFLKRPVVVAGNKVFAGAKSHEAKESLFSSET